MDLGFAPCIIQVLLLVEIGGGAPGVEADPSGAMAPAGGCKAASAPEAGLDWSKLDDPGTGGVERKTMVSIWSSASRSA